MRSFRLMVLPAVLGLATVPMLAAPSGAAASSTAARCSVTSYIGSHKVTSFRTQALVTHALQVTIPPHGKHSQTEEAVSVTSVTATTTTSGGAKGSASWVWASVSAHFEHSVAKAGEHTSKKTVKVSDTVSNTTKKNQVYVAYKGVTRYTGSYYTTYCKGDGHGSTVGTVARHNGTYKTWAGLGQGIAWCKGGAPSALVKAAIKGYCR